MVRPAEIVALPLLDWPERREIVRLAARRDELARRIAGLKPRTHRRIGLEAEMRYLTERQLRLEAERDGE